MYMPITDDVDHTNVYTKAKSILGRVLTNLAPSPFHHPRYGDFATMEGLWYYLTTGRTEEAFKTLNGFNAKKLGQPLPRIHLENFEEEIKLGFIYKLVDNPSILALLKDSCLPLTHYYYYGSIDNPKVIRLTKHDWQLQYWEELREALKQGIPLINLAKPLLDALKERDSRNPN